MTNRLITLSDILRTEQETGDFDFSFENIVKAKQVIVPEIAAKANAVVENAVEDTAVKTIGGRVLMMYPLSSFNFDKYRFNVKRIQCTPTDELKANLGKKVDLTVFPLIAPDTVSGTTFTTDVAGCIFDSESIFCVASPIHGNKPSELNTNNFNFMVRARWENNKFLSWANPMSWSSERYIWDTKKKTVRPDSLNIKELGHPVFDYKGKTLHIVPLLDRNVNGYCPIIIVYDDENTRYMIATESVAEYENIKIAARYGKDNFEIYGL